jgi:Probable transposase/Helix-turn-helix domain
MERRKVTFKLYPNAAQAERLTGWIRLHCELYNAAIEERIDAYRKHGKSISYYDQQSVLPEIKEARPEFVELGSHALQQTLRRLDLAFQAFFRRVKAGQTPGFPRFKASKRFAGFCHPDPAGWKLAQNGTRSATIRLGSGKDAMSIRARGQHRFGESVKANDLTITRKNGEWFASVTLRVSEDACARARTGDAHRGVDLGLNDWATFDNGETIANPRFVRNEMPRMADLQRQQARKQRGSIRYQQLGKQAAKLHERIGDLRREFEDLIERQQRAPVDPSKRHKRRGGLDWAPDFVVGQLACAKERARAHQHPYQQRPRCQRQFGKGVQKATLVVAPEIVVASSQPFEGCLEVQQIVEAPLEIGRRHGRGDFPSNCRCGGRHLWRTQEFTKSAVNTNCVLLGR